MPFTIQQEISFNESSSCAAEHENIYDKPSTLQPHANEQQKELHKHCETVSSRSALNIQQVSLPQTIRLMHTKSATLSYGNEASPTEDQAIMGISRSLQDIIDNGQYSRETPPSDLDAPAHGPFPFYQNNFLQVPVATNAVMTDTSSDTLARPKSTSFLDTRTEEIYEDVHDVVTSEYYTLPSG